MNIHYSNCPVCSSRKIQPILTAKDFTVSKEDFVIWQCNECTLRFTQDVPDAESIGPYYQSQDYISHTNTSKGLINQLYQKVRRYTLDQKAALIIQSTVAKGNLLDVGAGVGAFAHTMQQKGWAVTGIEPDAGARAQAKALFGVDLLPAEDFYQLPDRQFDAITLWHVLEHVHDLHGYVDRLKELLRPGGKLFIAVPNYTSKDAAHYRSHWAAYDVPRHLYHFSPKAMETLLRQHRIKPLEKKPMWFDSFYISLLSSKYKYSKTGWVGAGVNGLRSNLTAMNDKDRASSLIYVAANFNR
jgi:2-polyprenyl-3-methyl-5-hydroxy-6-metoxy-1,4-benzoquinol methylase